MKVCVVCGVEYQPVTEKIHNGIHRQEADVADIRWTARLAPDGEFTILDIYER
jgi:hypothetical protein